MRTPTTALMAGIVALGLATQAHARKIQMEAAYPDPGISTVHMNGKGEILQIEFADDSSLSADELALKPGALDRITLIEIFRLPFGLLVWSNLEDGKIVAAIHVPSTRIYGAEINVAALYSGNFVISLSADGLVERVQFPDGKVLQEPTIDLEEQDVPNINLIARLNYSLIEFQDLESGEMMRKVLKQSAW